MFNKLASKIPVKKQGQTMRMLVLGSIGCASFDGLMFMGFFTKEETTTTGIIFKKTVTEYHSLSDRLPYLYGAVVLLLITVFLGLFALAILMQSGRYKKYHPILKGIDDISIQEMASILNVSVQTRSK